MEGIVAILATLLIGAVGGNLAGMVLADRSLGLLWNSVVGILGGGIGFYIMGLVGAGFGGVAGSIAASFIGGAVLLFVVSLIRRA